MPMSDYVRGLRERIGTDVLEVPTVSVVVFDERDRVLLVRHVEGNVWTTPGGMIEPYELPADAAVRETWEETGLHVHHVRAEPGLFGLLPVPADGADQESGHHLRRNRHVHRGSARWRRQLHLGGKGRRLVPHAPGTRQQDARYGEGDPERFPYGSRFR